MRKTHLDPAFITEYRKLTGGDESTPLMPDEQAKVVKEIPRDAETIDLFKKFAGTGPTAALSQPGLVVVLTMSGLLQGTLIAPPSRC